MRDRADRKVWKTFRGPVPYGQSYFNGTLVPRNKSLRHSSLRSRLRGSLAHWVGGVTEKDTQAVPAGEYDYVDPYILPSVRFY